MLIETQILSSRRQFKEIVARKNSSLTRKSLERAHTRIRGPSCWKERSHSQRGREKEATNNNTHTATHYETRRDEALLSYTACATFSLSAVQDNVKNMCKREINNNGPRWISGTENVRLCERNNACLAPAAAQCEPAWDRILVVHVLLFMLEIAAGIIIYIRHCLF